MRPRWENKLIAMHRRTRARAEARSSHEEAARARSDPDPPAQVLRGLGQRAGRARVGEGADRLRERLHAFVPAHHAPGVHRSEKVRKQGKGAHQDRGQRRQRHRSR